MKEGKRSDRVGEQLRMEIADLLIRGKLRDPDAKDVIVSGVKVTDDLSIARVYVRVLGEADEARRGRVVRALQRAAGFLRRELGPKLRLRRTPELDFHWDELIDRVEGIERALHEIDAERRGASQEDES
ncbi:MAG: 30S ribosome-binding factor RbfA [Sandaracinus sp.]|nr:30S ribosome-binding factor RbfA [Myxococcales bacterium]MCB9600751.1 30S ribosome-binding factor RbfA [Sandaracinus sp.]MCB9614301.1 30S ribosome-binding factor RbfA [Sandaracinus sp.]